MKVSTIALALSIVLAAPAFGGPGDPRLVQGKLEWPATLTGGEPFIVLRGDDGRVYYADVMAAQRYVQGSLSAGGHAALLGLEGIKPHEILGVALGSGDMAALSLALAQPTSTPSPATPPPVATTAPPPVTAAPPVATTAPPPATAAPPPATAAVAPPAATAPPVITPAPGPDNGRSWPRTDSRWVTLRGKVHGLAGQNLFLRKDDGGVVAIDIAKLNPTAAERLRLGSSVAIVVVPFANKYEATGLIEAEPAKSAR
jgi:hypothetical protein